MDSSGVACTVCKSVAEGRVDEFEAQLGALSLEKASRER